MAEVPVTISGVLYDKLDRTSKPVTLVGELSRTDLGVGGGPIVPGEPPRPWDPTFPTPPIHIPGEPPGIWGPTDPRPTPPIVIPPVGTIEHPIVLPPLTPSHPIVIPGDPPDLIIWPPLPNNDLPKPPEVPPIIGCRSLVYSLRYGWALVMLPKK